MNNNDDSKTEKQKQTYLYGLLITLLKLTKEIMT